MSEKKNDILVEIPDEQLPKLAVLYEEKARWAPYMVNFIKNGLKMKKSDKYKDSIVFLSPNNSWEEDGTIIVIITVVSEDIFVFTLDEQCVNLYQGLIKTNLIKHGAKNRSLFFAVHEKHTPTVKKYIEEKNLTTFEFSCFLYALPLEQAQNFTVECPSNVYLKKLDSSAAKQMNDVWPLRFPDSDQYIAYNIDVNGGYGIFLKSTDEMVTWVLQHTFGHLAMLQTEDEHKRKGYGIMVTKALSKEISEKGQLPFATIVTSNKPSVAMFEKLGFSSIGTCTFIEIK